MMWLHLTNGKKPYKTAYMLYSSICINYKSMPTCIIQVSVALTSGRGSHGRKQQTALESGWILLDLGAGDTVKFHFWNSVSYIFMRWSFMYTFFDEKFKFRADKMVHPIKCLPCSSYNLVQFLELTVEGGEQSLKVVLWPSFSLTHIPYTHIR